MAGRPAASGPVASLSNWRVRGRYVACATRDMTDPVGLVALGGVL